MIEDVRLEQLSREDLIALNRALQGQVASLQAQVVALQGQVKTLQAEIDALKRDQSRPAAPFSRGKRKANPKPPGRKQGQGPFTYRRPPNPEELTAPSIDVAVTLADCPACGGPLVEERTDLAYLTDLPEVIRPSVRQYRVGVGRCTACGERVRGEHPDLAPDQWGATAHRLGPRVKAFAHALHYDLGVPQRKVPEILRLLCGIEVTQSALTHDALRQAEGVVGAVARALKDSVKAAPQVNTDDTGWRVEGEPAYLMTFVTEEATVYQIRSRHTNEQVREVVPADYAGVMGCDRGTSYDAQELRAVKQQKCIRHILRSIEAELEADPDHLFARALAERIETAHGLWRDLQQGRIDRETYRQEGDRIDREVSLGFVTERVRLWRLRTARRQLSDRDRACRRLVEGIGEQHERGHLLRFLKEPTIEPTNNAAERALRPAVIARKVSHCSKTGRGAVAHAAFLSVIRTARQARQSVLDALVRLQRLSLLGSDLAHAPP
jgi:hypothetical protein